MIRLTTFIFVLFAPCHVLAGPLGEFDLRGLATGAVRRQNLMDLKLPELRETLAHQVVLMLITVMHLLAERQGL